MNKSKNFIKTFVFAFAFLLTLALTLGITGAWYNTRRQADGVITMSDGIVIEYSGFGQGSGEWQNNSADFLLFATNNEAGPGTTATLNGTGIKAGSGSANFFVRAKLEYKFFTDVEGLTDVTSQISDYSAFINTPTFAQGWVDSRNGDGWFYYATGTTFNTIPSAEYVNVFTPGQSITLNGAADGFNHQGGGYKYSNEILIKRVTVVLTLEAYQADLAAAANAGWEIVPAYTDAAGVVYTQNANETWTLTDGVSATGDYTVLSEITQENETNDVVAIAPKAFKNAATLTAVTIPATIASVGEDAFTGTGLTEVTIENEDSVITGIESAGIPTASTINVPAAVSGNYEILLPSNNVVATASPQQGLTLTATTSDNGSYGTYMATDDEGNKWYFDFGYLNANYTRWTIDNNGTQVQLRKWLINDNGTGFSEPNIVLQFPTTIINNNTNCSVVDISQEIGWGNSNWVVSSVLLPQNLKHIGQWAFTGFSSLDTVSIPNTVEVIGESSFLNCTGLTSINIPDSVTMIGKSAFAGCTNLESVVIPSSVNNIGFYLTDYGIYNYPDQTGGNIFESCVRLENITSTGSYTTLNDGKCLVYGDVLIAVAPYNITTFTIPSNITIIDEYIFRDFNQITTMIIDSSTIAALNSSNSCLLDYATTVYVLDSLTVGDYIGNWGHITESDQTGYVKYVKNA